MNKRYANTPNFPFLDNLDIDQDVKSRLSINLSRIYSGSKDILVSPIAKEHGADNLLSEWNKVFQGNRELMNDTLIDLEESQFSKCGPRSISIPWSERWTNVNDYFKGSLIDYSTLKVEVDPRVKGKLRPLHVKSALGFLKNSTNSGLPFYTNKGKVKDRVLERFDYYLSKKYPCILFTRTQEQGKTRDVWGYPIADTLNEMRFHRPLLEHQRKQFWRSALLGPDSVNRRMTHIIKSARLRGYSLVSIDFSTYDHSIKQGLQLKVGEVYKHLFQSKYSSEIDEIIKRKSTIGLVTPDGVKVGEHGEPSGATLTNEDDSICQYLIASDSGCLIEDLFDIQGDDGVYALPHDQVKSLFNNFRKYGLKVNEDKSYISDKYLIYLQNLYHSDYSVKGEIKGIYPTFRALNRILYQERWSNFEDFGIVGKDYYSIRALSILENCKWHPLFEKLVKFVLKYDKYRLRTTQLGIHQYIKMVEESQGSEGIIYNQYEDNVRGIRSFESFKLASKLI